VKQRWGTVRPHGLWNRQRCALAGIIGPWDFEAAASLDEARYRMSAFKQGGPQQESAVMMQCIARSRDDTTKPHRRPLTCTAEPLPDCFRNVFNNERPHEGLNNQTLPSSLYRASTATTAQAAGIQLN